MTNQINNPSIIPSTDVIQLTLTLKMTTAQVVETSVTVNNNSPIQDYVHPDDQTQPFVAVLLVVLLVAGALVVMVVLVVVVERAVLIVVVVLVVLVVMVAVVLVEIIIFIALMAHFYIKRYEAVLVVVV